MSNIPFVHLTHEGGVIDIEDALLPQFLFFFGFAIIGLSSEDNRIPVQDAKIVLWTILTAIYNNELVEEPERREIIINNIERQKDCCSLTFWGRNDTEEDGNDEMQRVDISPRILIIRLLH